MRRASLLSLAVLLLACDKSGDTKTADAKADTKSEAQADAKPKADAKPEAKPETKAEAKPAAKAPIAADAKATVGSPAPDFTLTDLDGTEHTLSKYAGKTVVLEWFNPKCPFVNHAHKEGSLVTMAKDETAKDIVWLAINSGAPGKQGHGPDANAEGVKTFGLTHPVLIDETGAVGRAYAAEKTPHMFLIDAKGRLVYRGAIDNAPFGEVDGGGDKINHLAVALAEVAEGKPVSNAETPAYGCTVKY